MPIQLHILRISLYGNSLHVGNILLNQLPGQIMLHSVPMLKLDFLITSGN